MNKKKRWYTLAALALVMITWGGFEYRKKRLPNEIPYMEKAAGIRFPKEISEFVVAHPREFCFAGRMKLPEEGATNFIRTSGFVPENQFPLNYDFSAAPKTFGNPSSITNWCGLKGRNQVQRWEFAYDPNNRLLWFVFLFPDMSGDSPP